MRQLTKQPSFFETHSSIAPEELANFELKYGLNLPQSIRDIILTYSGAPVLECIIPVDETYYEKILYFLPLISNPNHSSIEFCLSLYIEDYGYTETIPLIAVESGVLTIGIGPNNLNKVYLALDGGQGFDEFENFDIEGLFNALVPENAENSYSPI